jgi:phage replication-related protein YjqB (UPF0714/DUF867 family)
VTDRFRSFSDLSAASEAEVDYRIEVQNAGSATVILAPHGGTIEPGTAEIARALAGERLSLYVFETLQPGAHGDFHITSHLFDEPKALSLVAEARTAVAIHGRRSGGSDTVGTGGLDAALRDSIGEALVSAGFDAAPNTRLPGEHPGNICNRTRSGAGVQLELSPELRRRLTRDQDAMQTFCDAIRAVLP